MNTLLLLKGRESLFEPMTRLLTGLVIKKICLRIPAQTKLCHLRDKVGMDRFVADTGTE